MKNIYTVIFNVSLAIVIGVSIIGVVYNLVPVYAQLTDLQRKKDALHARKSALESSSLPGKLADCSAFAPTPASSNASCANSSAWSAKTS
jgi:DNA gyrase/topoisomerase IV subunit B